MEIRVPETNDQIENRRIDRRIKTKLPVVMHPAGHQHAEGIVTNVSANGAFLHSLAKLPKNTELLLYLPLLIGRKKRMCPVVGKIVRVDHAKGEVGCGYGIRFAVEISSSSKRILQDFLEYEVTGSLPSLRETTSSYEIRLKRASGRTSSKPRREPVMQRKSWTSLVPWILAVGGLAISLVPFLLR